MKYSLCGLTALALIGAAFVTSANAVLIAGWQQFKADGATYPAVANVMGANIGSAALNTAGIRHRANAFELGGDVSAADGSKGTWNTGSTVNLAQYIEFEVQAISGFEVDYTNLQLNARMDEGNLDMILRSSVDGFTSDLGTIDLTNSYRTYSLDLSSLAPQTGTVAFRLYGTNANSYNVYFEARNSSSVAGNGFAALNGAVSAIPEPSAFLFFGVAASIASATAMRRRRRPISVG